MRRSGKILLIIAACFLVFGILLAVGSGIALRNTGMHWWRNDTNATAVTTQFAEMDSINSLSLTLVNEPIFIVSGGDRVTIEWSQRYDGQYRLTQREGQSLSLSRQPSGRRNHNVFGIGWFQPNWRGISGIEDASDRPVTVTIPEGMSLSEIDLSGADIRVSMDNIYVRDLEISGANTIVSLTNVDARDIEIFGANAEVTLTQVSSGSIEVSGANATLELRETVADDIEVNGASAVATAYLESIDGWGFDVSGLNSELRVDGQRAGGIRGSRTISVSGLNAILNVWTR